MLWPGGGATWTIRDPHSGWRCSGRCGFSSAACPSRCPGRSGGRCSHSWRSPRAGPSASNGWGTHSGRATCRNPDGRPCRPTSPACAPTSDPPQPARRPATADTGWAPAPTGPRLRPRHGGYRLDLAADGLDLAQARRLLARGRETPDLAVLKDAHALWRGPVLTDLTDVEPIAVAVEDCAQLYREVTDALIECAVGAGRAGDVVGLATATHADDPLREPAVLLLMRVLAATGQAPEALRTGREYRRRLADETGLDPSPALAALERDIASGSGNGSPAPVEHTRPTTRLFGREAQVATLHRLIRSERLVTVVGAGGVGKTRVALEVAQRSEASTVLLLAPVTDPAAIPHALAAALNLQVAQGDVLAACIALLGNGPGLLVVDNCEHLVDAARDTIGVLLSACPGLAVLATSREPLGLAAEYAFRLAPLALPDSDRALAEGPSVAGLLPRPPPGRPPP